MKELEFEMLGKVEEDQDAEDDEKEEEAEQVNTAEKDWDVLSKTLLEYRNLMNGSSYMFYPMIYNPPQLRTKHQIKMHHQCWTLLGVEWPCNMLLINGLCGHWCRSIRNL